MLLTGEAPPTLERHPNVLDQGMEEGTEFGPTPEENLLSVAAVVFRDLEQAGFTTEEIERIAERVGIFTKTARGGRN